jgi:hypothetical protein
MILASLACASSERGMVELAGLSSQVSKSVTKVGGQVKGSGMGRVYGWRVISNAAPAIAQLLSLRISIPNEYEQSSQS